MGGNKDILVHIQSSMLVPQVNEIRDSKCAILYVSSNLFFLFMHSLTSPKYKSQVMNILLILYLKIKIEAILYNE